MDDKAIAPLPESVPRHKTVLVVDGDAVARKDICSTLELEGYATFEASTADEALVPIHAHVPFFAVVCEANLRGEHDGLWLYDQIQSQPRRVKFIFVSRKEFNPKGRTVSGIMRKPVNVEQLLKLLNAP